MILNYNELTKYNRKVVMVDGGFDPLHIGHIKYFEEACKLGFPVLCNVQSDEYIKKVKKRPPLLPENQRIKVIDSIKYISYVHLCNTSTHDVLKQLKPLKYIKGIDWESKGLPEIEQIVCKELGIEIIYLNTILDSSTNIVNNFAINIVNNSIKEFENFIFTQKPINSSYYNEQYFKGNWRTDENNYSLDKRRIIEGRNPLNIKHVFNPNRVLDVGCGPGALMYFLYELGIECYGIDFSKTAKELSPPEIKNNIIIAPVTEFYDFGFDFDLVICRELLEHLTVLQIKKTIKVLADYTSKYLYVTARFHPSPIGLLDITDDTLTDPTHITLLNKDFVKLLFMLEGLTPRPDLEKKMDWKNLGRVLVFERRS